MPAQSPRSFGSTEAQETSTLRAGVVDGAVGAHQRGEEFLGLAGARVAAADADFLARRRRVISSPAVARQLDHRIGLGIVHPARAAIERHVEGRDVGLAAAADLVRRLHHDHLAVRRHDPPRRSNAGRARADHDNVGLARQRRGSRAAAEHRRRRQRRGRRQEVAAGHCHVMVSGDLKEREQLANLPHLTVRSNNHGKSIMIDPFRRMN